MVEKDGPDSEKDAFKAYRAAAREETETTGVEEEADHVSSALIDKVGCSTPDILFMMCWSFFT